MKDLTQDKPFWGLGEVLSQAWPAALSMLNGTIMIFVDGLMVARLGPTELSAQLTGAILAFAPTGLGLGILQVVNTYVSQNLGAGRLDRCGAYAWAGQIVAAGFSILLLPVLLLAPWLFDAIGHEQPLRNFETIYFQWMIVGIWPFLAARVLEQFFYGIERPWVVLLAGAIGNGMNVLLNWLLIFGHWGLPKMGLHGAGLGTILGEIVILGVLLALFLRGRPARRYATRELRNVRWADVIDILRIGWACGMQLFNDVLCWGVVTSVLIGWFGTAHLAANTAVVRYISISFMPAVGIGIATTALVGRYIGEGRPDLARRRAHVAMLTSLVYMGCCGIVFYIFREPLVRFYVHFEPDPAETAVDLAEIVAIGGRLMILAAIFQVFDAMGIIFLSALRGAGDTRWPMLATFTLSWIFMVGGGVTFTTQLPSLTSLGPWLGAAAYIIALAVVLAWRFEAGRWMKIDLLQGPRPARAARAVPPAESPAEIP